jgi:hypothetical protein
MISAYEIPAYLPAAFVESAANPDAVFWFLSSAVTQGENPFKTSDICSPLFNSANAFTLFLP